MFCGQCGQKLPDSAKFCSRCGAKVVRVSPRAASKPSPAVSVPAVLNASFGLFKKSGWYDMDSLEGINAIPVPAKNYNTGDWKTSEIYYILQRKATEHKKAGRMDLAIACLRKSNALSDYEARSPLLEKDYMRLVKYLQAAGDKAGAAEAEAAIRRRHPEFADKRYSNLPRIQAELRRAADWKVDLVDVDSLKGCPICAKYGNKTYSISGRSRKYPRLPSEFYQRGGFCPDCIVGFSVHLDY